VKTLNIKVKKAFSRDYKDGLIVFPNIYMNSIAGQLWKWASKYEEIEENQLIINLLSKIKNSFHDIPEDEILKQDISEFIEYCLSSGLFLTDESIYKSSQIPVEMNLITSAELVLSHLCNYRCPHCYIEAGNPLNNEISHEQWLLIVQKLMNLGLMHLVLSGGEPTCYKNITKILAKVPYVYITILTNGSLIGETNLLNQLLKLKDRLAIQITLNSHDPVKHNLLTKSQTFQNVINNIKLLVSNGIKPIIITQVSLENKEDIVNGSFSDFLVELGINRWIVQPCLRNIGRALEKPNDSIDIFETINFVNKFTLSYNSIIKDSNVIETTLEGPAPLLYNTQFFSDEKSYESCQGETSNVSIDSNGDIYICSEFISLNRNKVSNILADSEESIIEKLNTLKIELKDQISRLKGICQLCNLKNSCGGGCRADAFGFYNDVYAPSPVCQRLYEANLFPKELMFAKP
jgi:radical SAM protein with 4Fe4S-binding SPASM domain